MKTKAIVSIRNYNILEYLMTKVNKAPSRNERSKRYRGLLKTKRRRGWRGSLKTKAIVSMRNYEMLDHDQSKLSPSEERRSRGPKGGGIGGGH